MLIKAESLSFLLVFLSPIPHSCSRDFSAAVQLWNFSRFSKSYPAPICDPAKLWFLLHLFGIQTTFDISLPVHPPNFTWEAAYLQFFSDIFCEVYQIAVPAAFTTHFNLVYLKFYNLWCTYEFFLLLSLVFLAHITLWNYKE